MMRKLLLFAALISSAFAQFPEPEASEQTAMIARMRTAALAYGDQLKDFICIQLTSRSADDSGTGKRFKLLETQELELAYIAHKENHKLLKVNGKTTDLEKRVKKGYFVSGGEFGSKLQQIFDPKANAEFGWDHGELSAGKRSCVFRYNVPVSTTTLSVQVNGQIVKLGHHGLVYADCDTGAVTRFQLDSDSPTIREQGHNIQIGSQLDVRYGPVMIDSKEFLLPQTAVSIARFNKRLTKAEIEFQQYRKYDSNSTITFDPPK